LINGLSAFDTTDNVGLFPQLSQHGGTNGFFGPSVNTQADNYRIGLSTLVQPVVLDLTTGQSYALAAGVTDFGSGLNAGRIEFSTPAARFVAPLAVTGNVQATSLSGAGLASIGVIAT